MNKITFIIALCDGRVAKVIIQDPQKPAKQNEERYINLWKELLFNIYHIASNNIHMEDKWEKAKKMTRNDVLDELMERDAENPDTIKEYLRDGFLGYGGMNNFGLEVAYKKAFNKEIIIIIK